MLRQDRTLYLQLRSGVELPIELDPKGCNKKTLLHHQSIEAMQGLQQGGAIGPWLAASTHLRARRLRSEKRQYPRFHDHRKEFARARQSRRMSSTFPEPSSHTAGRGGRHPCRREPLQSVVTQLLGQKVLEQLPPSDEIAELLPPAT